MASNHNHGRDQNVAHTIYIQNNPLESVLEKLSKHAAFSALHNSEARGPRTGVHEGTREEFIENLGEWIEDPVEGARAQWVRGGAGVGKSAVAQTICDKYAGTRLAGSYYFSRNDNSRNTIDHFIPTIAYQLAKSHGVHSQLASKIGDILNSDPSIMNTNLEEQFNHLICAPCAAVDADLWTSLPRLIVIDGLDECMDHDPQTNEINWKTGEREGQRRLISIIRNATATHPPLPLHFLIFSRPEHTIFTSFRSHSFIPPLEEFDMRELRAQADADIKKYLRHEFTRFPKLHPDAGIEESWPGEDAIDKLTINADGHFVYIKTAVKYVAGDDPYLLTPQDRLAVVLRTSETSLYPDLSTMDQLYQHILQPFMGIRERTLLPILQLIISPHLEPGPTPVPVFSPDYGLRCRSRNAIAKLLKLNPQQVSTILYRLQSILHVPDDDHREDVSVLHASFSDFLIDKHRSLHFHIEPLKDRVYFGMLLQCLLPILNNMTQKYAAGERMSPEITNFELYSIDILRFVVAIFNVSEGSSEGMLQNSYIPSKELLHAINEFDVYHYINMLVDRDYMCQIYMVFKDLNPFRNHTDVCTIVLFLNMSYLHGLYFQCTECTQLVPGPSLPYTSQFCSQLGPFIENHRSLFEDGWLAKLPKICTSGTLSQLALLIALVCTPFPSGYGYGDLVSFLNLPKDADNSESHILFKVYHWGTDLLDLHEGSDIEYISCEKGRIFVDGMQTLGHNLGGYFYSTAAGKRGIRAFTTGQFTGLDEWNSEISMLLDLWPSKEGYFGVEDADWTSHLEDWSFDSDDIVSSPELAIPDTKLEDPEDILDYGREFPWRLKTPPRERSGFEQPESAGELPQTDKEEVSELCMVKDGLSIVEGDRNHEKDKVTTPQLNNEPSIKAPGSEQDQPTGLADELLSIQDAPRPPDSLKTRLSEDEAPRAADAGRVQPRKPTDTRGFWRYLW